MSSVSKEQLITDLTSYKNDGSNRDEASASYLSKYVRNGVTLNELIAASGPDGAEAIVKILAKLNLTGGGKGKKRRMTRRKRAKKRSTRRRRR